MAETGRVGYYLIDKGFTQLDARRISNDRFGTRHGAWDAFAVSLCGRGSADLLLFTAGLVVKAHDGGLSGWALGLRVLLVLPCVGQLAVALVNWLVTLRRRHGRAGSLERHPSGLTHAGGGRRCLPACRTLKSVRGAGVGF
jgi:hypothetical protein